MRDVKVIVKKYDIPENLKNKNYSTDEQYRENFKNGLKLFGLKKIRN